MADQLNPGRELDLSELDGQLVAWRQDYAQPALIDIEGQPFVPIFKDGASLHDMMGSLGITNYTIKRIDEGYDFMSSLIEAGVRACFNVHRHGVKLRYTEVRMNWKNS